MVDKARVFCVVLLFSPSFALGQTAPVVSVNPQVLIKDASHYLAYNSSDTAERLIEKHQNFDPIHNTYVVANSLREELSGTAEPSTDSFVEAKKLVWNSDAVIIGTPNRRVSSLTDSHQFVFSDYEITVDMLLNDPTRKLAGYSHLVVSRVGGDVRLGNAAFSAIDPDFPLFHLGKSYLFFLHYNPGSGSFSVTASGSFLVVGDRVISARTHPRFAAEPVDRLSLINQIHIAAESDRRVTR